MPEAGFDQLSPPAKLNVSSFVIVSASILFNFVALLVITVSRVDWCSPCYERHTLPKVHLQERAPRNGMLDRAFGVFVARTPTCMFLAKTDRIVCAKCTPLVFFSSNFGTETAFRAKKVEIWTCRQL